MENLIQSAENREYTKFEEIALEMLKQKLEEHPKAKEFSIEMLKAQGRFEEAEEIAEACKGKIEEEDDENKEDDEEDDKKEDDEEDDKKEDDEED